MNLINESLRTYAYDNNHNIVFSRLEYWENGAWENISQKIHEYDMESKNPLQQRRNLVKFKQQLGAI